MTKYINPRHASYVPPEPKEETVTVPKAPPRLLKGRCFYCKTKLKMVGFDRAIACRKCGRIQPWAETPV